MGKVYVGNTIYTIPPLLTLLHAGEKKADDKSEALQKTTAELKQARKLDVLNKKHGIPFTNIDAKILIRTQNS